MQAIGRLIVLTFLALFTLSGAALSPREHQAAIDSGITLTLDQDYESAIRLFERQARSDPSNPL